MATSGGERDWKKVIYKRLADRNKRQCACFSGLITTHNKLYESVDTLKSRNLQLSVETEKLKQESLDLRIKIETSGADGFVSQSTHALEQKIYKLQEELTELHRKKGENAQRIIDLNNILQEKEKELAAKELRLQESEGNVSAMQSANNSLEGTIMELEATNQMLKDEQQALQLAFVSLEEKFRKCQQDNNDLVARWMEQKAVLADKLNEDNDTQFRRRQEKLKKELADAAKEPKFVREHRERSTSGPTTISPPPFCLSVSLPSKSQYKFDAHEGEVNAIKWSSPGRMFASGGTDRKVNLWEIRNYRCECTATLMGSNSGIMSVEFDAAENLVLAASADFASRVWSIADQRLRHTLTGHSGKVLSAKFLGDANKVVSGSYDRTLKIWDLASKACIKTIFAGSSCNDLVTSDGSGSNIISAHFDKRIRFWDTRSESSANEISLQGKVTSLDLSPDHQYLLSCSRDDTLKLIDLRMNQVMGTFCSDGFKVAADWTRAIFSPDGEYVAAGSSDGSLYIWCIRKNNVEKVLKEHGSPVIACSWHPYGQQIVSCEKHKKAVLWSDF